MIVKTAISKAQEIEIRAISAADMYLETPSATVRSIAKIYHTSKSTIHRDFRTNLPKIDQGLADKVAKKLDENLEARSSRGGQALARKYASQYRRWEPMW